MLLPMAAMTAYLEGATYNLYLIVLPDWDCADLQAPKPIFQLAFSEPAEQLSEVELLLDCHLPGTSGAVLLTKERS